MYKLWATIVKDFRVLSRDKVGLTLMFAMPILLVLVITSIQNSTFELVNNKKMALIVCNKDTGQASREYLKAIEKVGMFTFKTMDSQVGEKEIKAHMHENEILIALVVPDNFSQRIQAKAQGIAQKALHDTSSTAKPVVNTPLSLLPITLYYHPVLEESFRYSVNGALRSTLQIVEGREIVQYLYSSIYTEPLPADLEQDILANTIPIAEIPASKDGSRKVPNATQHNVPAWTVFAMFFIVISLGGGVVREKQSGSFIRLKTLPTNYLIALLSKQITYLIVTLVQVVVIFSLGIWLFPYIGLPKLSLPNDLLGLAVVSAISGWCAVSYAICIGTLAQTQEQANGFGAVSIIMLAAIGGILVPSFAMPSSFELAMKLSPLHWCLESFYGLFLEQGTFWDILASVAPLLLFILAIQSISLYSLKRKNLI